MIANLIDREKHNPITLYAVEINKRTSAIFDDYNLAQKYMDNIENKENFYISVRSFELNES